jgi:ABC-2 type transport system ATP-binding protein
VARTAQEQDMDTIIEVKDLSHQFGTKHVLEGLNYTVCEGEVFGVLGPNGAGKTTNVRLLNGVLAPTGGSVRVLGMDPVANGSKVRSQTGVLTETPSLYERLSGRDNLLTFGALYGVPEADLKRRVDAILDQFGLLSRAADLTGSYSKGMKQRLALARAFLHEPKVMFLDEPTSALDPEAARQVTGLIEQISHKRNCTVFLCTHNLDEAQRLCDRVAVLSQGRLLACGSIEELSRTLWRGSWVDVAVQQQLSGNDLQTLSDLPFVKAARQPNPGCLEVQVEEAGQTADLIACLVGMGVRILSAAPRKHTLEEIYFAIESEGN